MEILGMGGESTVYVHPHDETKVVKLRTDRHPLDKYSLRKVFYLTKIIHALLPQTFPDIHAVGYEFQNTLSSFLVYDRVFPNDEYERLMSLRCMDNEYMSSLSVDEQRQNIRTFSEQLQTHEERIYSSHEYKQLQDLLKTYHVCVDVCPINYCTTIDGSFVYLDGLFSFVVADLNETHPLSLAVDQIEDEALRRRCKNWIRRFRELSSMSVQEALRKRSRG